MFDIVMDGIIDTIKLFPYLFITFLILEFIELKINKKNEKVLIKYRKFGPFFGGLLGGLPQCGFGAMAASLFSNHVISMGCVVAIFLATSDEMLPIMLSHNISLLDVLKIISFKVVVGIIVGFIVDLLYKRKNDQITIQSECLHEHCDCKENGILFASLKHSIKILLFILFVNLLLNGILYYVGEDVVKDILKSNNIITYFLASLVGLIPNCGSSVIITELYLSNFISLGVLLSGLLTGSGIGILLLFKNNKKIVENISVLTIVYFVGVIIGFIIDIII